MPKIMKNKMSIEAMRFLFSVVFFSVLFSVFPAFASQIATVEKDGIVLNVTIAEDADRTKVVCVVINRSEFSICSGSIRYKQVFYVKLTDADGAELPMREEWADIAAQKSSRVYKNPISQMAFQINPGEFVDGGFYLEDAYPVSSIERAQKLEISWETQYFGSETDFDGNPYRFPPDWKTSVTIPLTDEVIEEVSKAEIEKNETTESSVGRVEDIPVSRSEVKNVYDWGGEYRFYWIILAVLILAISCSLIFWFLRNSSTR